MPRPRKCRRICSMPENSGFEPLCKKGRCREEVILNLDEYEVIRLIDLENMTQEECAVQIAVSRTTVTSIYDQARGKIADAIINSKRLIIAGGDYEVCDHKRDHCKRGCRHKQQHNLGGRRMKIAVTYEEGNIFQHFGQTKEFKVYDIEEGKIVGTSVISTTGDGHGALGDFLNGLKVDALICGGIGGGAKTVLAEAKIDLYPGVVGNADFAVENFLVGKLNYNPETMCNHHGEGEHTCGDHEESHSCGNH